MLRFKAGEEFFMDGQRPLDSWTNVIIITVVVNAVFHTIPGRKTNSKAWMVFFLTLWIFCGFTRTSCLASSSSGLTSSASTSSSSSSWEPSRCLFRFGLILGFQVTLRMSAIGFSTLPTLPLCPLKHWLHRSMVSLSCLEISLKLGILLNCLVWT